MKKLLERIGAGEVLVGDGAMGTMLFARGLKAGDCPEAMNLTQPEVLTEIATLYSNAGADIIQTNTFGGSPLKLAAYSLQEQVEEINRNAVSAVRKAVGDRALVSGSCGPSGKILKPYGDSEPNALLDSFQHQINTLICAGVDIICIETMIDLTEAILAIKATKQVSPNIPIITTMTFDPTPKGFFTIMGSDIQTVAEGLAKAGADVIGSNCGNGIDNMVKIAAEFGKLSKLPLIIQSNAGLPELKDGNPVYTETPEYMAGKVRELIDCGVSIIGGCCGTTPEHIRAIRDAVDSYNKC